MIKNIILFPTLLLSCLLTGQQAIDMQIEIGAPYPTELEYYLQNADNLFISGMNTTNNTVDIYYHVQLTGDNGIDVRTMQSYKPMQPVTYQPFETKFYSGNDLESDFSFNYPQDVDVSNLTQEQYDFITYYRALPEGTYQLCISVFDFTTDVLISTDCSAEFNVAYGDPPYIYMPANEEEVLSTANSMVTIGWEPPFLSNPGLGNFTYILEMIDITENPFGDIELMFSNPGTYDILYTENLISTIYNFTFPPENIALEPDHEYALRVRAVDPTSSTPLPNNGYSPISVFTYIAEEETSTPPTSQNPLADCGIPCLYTPSIPETPATSIGGFDALDIGNFRMDNITFENTDPISASGSGRVAIPFLEGIYVDVVFSNISINSQGRVYNGDITAIVDYDPDTENMTAEEAEAYDNYLRTERALENILGVESIGLPIAFEKGIGGTNLLFGLSDITFSPTQATCSIIQNFHIPKLGFEGWAALQGEEICLLPGGIDDVFLQPQNDIVIPYEGGIEITIKAGQEQTGIDLNCQGIEKIKITGEAKFPESTLVKSENGSPTNQPAIGTFTILIDGGYFNQATLDLFGNEGAPSENGFNFIANLEMEPFHLAMIPDWGITTNEIFIDFSDYENPPNLSWPEGYNSPYLDGTTMDLTWHGVFIPGIEVLTPQNFLGLEEPKVIEVNQVLIDPNINLEIEVNDLITLDEGNVDGWAISVDQLNISIIENALSAAGFGGEISVPITAEDENFAYDAIISYDPNENLPTYTLSISSLNEINLPFAVAKATLSQNSYVTASFNASNESENYIEIFLEGGLAVQSSEFEPGGNSNANPPLSLPAVDFSLNYHSKNGFSNSHFGFAEPTTNNFDPSWGGEFNNESLGGFPVNISEVTLSSTSANNVEFRINPEIVIASGGHGISVNAEIFINSKYETNNNRKKLIFDNLGLSELTIDADPFGIELYGSVEFYDDQKGGTTRHGVKGTLGVGFPMGLEANLAADFGTQTSNSEAEFGSSQNFNYWYLDGMVYLPTGIPIGSSGLGVYGFGGGVYINMAAGNDSLTMDEVNATLKEVRKLPPAGSDITHTGVVPVPSYGSYGLKLAGALGTIPEHLINMDLSIHAQFSENSGLNMVRLAGDVYHLTSINDRGEGGLWSTAFLQWDKITPDHHIFSGGMSVNLDMMALRGDPTNNFQVVDAAFQVEVGGNNVWYFHAGDPRIDNFGYLEFDFPLLPSITATGYFMAGHNLPNDLPIPERVEDILSNSNTSDGDNRFDNPNPVRGSSKRSEWDQILSQSAQGLAFGAALEVEAEIDAFLLYGRLSAFCGFDINITQDENRVCYIAQEGNYTPGWNNWYARGQVYAGLEGALGIEFRFCKKDYDIKLLELAAAIMASGGGPNPEWIEGRAGVSYSVLNGLFEGSKTFDITIGEKCVPEYTDPFSGIDIIYETYPVDEQTNISPFVNPTASFILPIGESFTLPVMEEDGSTTDHSFKLALDQFKIEGQISNGSGVPMAMSVLKEEIEVSEFEWDEENKQVSADLEMVLEPFTAHDLTIKLTAEEKINGDWQSLKDEDNNDWFEKKIINFSTGKLPYPIPDEEVAYCFPARRQRFFLQDEVILNPFVMNFKTNLKNGQNGYFPEDDETTTYNYFLRFQDLAGGEPIRKDLIDIENSSVIDEILNVYPELQLNTTYSVQLLRGEVPKLQPGQHLDRVITFQQLDQDNEMGSTTIVNIDTDPLDPGKTSSDNEAIIYQYYFKTSKYRTLNEKLAITDITKKHANTNADDLDYPVVTIHLDEPFDEVDIYGVKDGDEMLLSPRVQSYVSSSDGALVSGTGNFINNNDGGHEIEISSGYTTIEKPVSNLATHQGSKGFFNYCYDRYDGFIEIMDQVWEPEEPYYVYTAQVTIYTTDKLNGTGGTITGGGIHGTGGQPEVMSSDGTTSNNNGTITGAGANGLDNSSSSNTMDVDITWDPQRIEPYLNFHPDEQPHKYYFTEYEGVVGLLTDGMINNTWNKYLNQKDFLLNLNRAESLIGNGSQIQGNTPSNNLLGNTDYTANGFIMNELESTSNANSFAPGSMNNDLWIMNENVNLDDFHNASNIDFLGNNLDVVETNNSGFEESLTIHYNLHPKGLDDGDAMAEIANDFYFDIHYLRKVPSLQLTDDFFEENIPVFYENLGNMLNTSGYHYEKHNGEYFFKLQPNKGIGSEFLGGSNTTNFTFNKY